MEADDSTAIAAVNVFRGEYVTRQRANLRWDERQGWVVEDLRITGGFRGTPPTDRALAARVHRVALEVVRRQEPDVTTAVDRRILVLWEPVEGLGLSSGLIVSPPDLEPLSSSERPEGFVLALRCLILNGRVSGAWAELSDGDDFKPGSCASPQAADLYLLASAPRLHDPPDAPFGVQVRVYGAGRVGFRVWDVILTHDARVIRVDTLLSVS